MNFEEYIKLTRETAVYPENYERDYLIHGLVDEAGELKEKVKNNDKPNIGNFVIEEYESVIK